MHSVMEFALFHPTPNNPLLLSSPSRRRSKNRLLSRRTVCTTGNGEGYCPTTVVEASQVRRRETTMLRLRLTLLSCSGFKHLRLRLLISISEPQHPGGAFQLIEDYCIGELEK
ncbi:hypothetical protein LINPERPRIM_LOCUS831 [Linum perenne]